MVAMLNTESAAIYVCGFQAHSLDSTWEKKQRQSDYQESSNLANDQAKKNLMMVDCDVWLRSMEDNQSKLLTVNGMVTAISFYKVSLCVRQFS